jgi:hypothetical protein
MGEVIFLKRREAAGTAREADASIARSIDELPLVAPWRRRQFDAQLRAVIGVESPAQTGGAVVSAGAMKLYRCELKWNAAVYVLAESAEQATRAALREEFDHESPEVMAAEVCTLSRLHKNDHTHVPAGENPNCLTIAEHFGVDD